jgi:predicted histone-like DNA-binding protein
MAVKFKLTERANPLNPDAPKKWYAQAKSSGELTFRKLGKEVASASSTVSDTDMIAVLNDLTKVLCHHLANGQIVRFGDFGSFQITIGSSGADRPEKFNQSMIRSAKVVFRPGIDLKNTLATLKFKRG